MGSPTQHNDQHLAAILDTTLPNERHLISDCGWRVVYHPGDSKGVLIVTVGESVRSSRSPPVLPQRARCLPRCW